MTRQNAAQVERVYLLLTLLTTLAASFIWGVNTLFLLSAGLDATQAFAANAFFSLGQVLFEVPTGVVADTRGRRFSFLLGTATLLASTLLYLVMWQIQAPFIGWAFASILLHARATAFLIADGIFPGNDTRGYVLRKIMRRAIWHGNKLGFKDVFFAKVTNFVVDQFGEAYPELRETRGVIERVVTTEERLYISTAGAGLNMLEDVMKKTSGKVISGADVFKLYDTYGLRYDLIEYVAEQRGFTLDQEGFEAELEKQRQRARESMKGGAAKIVNPVYQKIAQRGRTEFTGYAGTELSGSKVTALVRNGELVDEIVAGDEAEIVLDRTPFYAESGGQVGDVGVLENDDARLLVTDAYSPTSGVTVHLATVEQGGLKIGDTINAHVDAEKRARTMANHTATHLLHAALREVLGPHVKQAGSLVAPDRLRFDFTHFAPLTQEEIAEIERLVNEQTLKNTSVSKEEKTLDEALASGAMALFGEKYSDRVRVVSVPGFSTELCGGTHVNATGDIGVFKIISDASIASGTRRIEAVTGKNAYERFALSESLLADAAARLNTAPQRLCLSRSNVCNHNCAISRKRSNG